MPGNPNRSRNASTSGVITPRFSATNGNGSASDQNTLRESGPASLLTYATVLAIDPPSRLIALELPDGRTAVARVGDGVENFDQLQLGEVVVVRYVEPAVIAISKTDMPQQQDQQKSPNSQPQASQQEEPQTSQRAPGRPQAPQQQQPQASSSARPRMEGNAVQDESLPKAIVSGKVADVDRNNGVLVVHSDDGDELVMHAPDGHSLTDLGKGDRVLVTYTEAAIVGIQPVEDSDQLLRAQKRGGTSNDVEDSDQQSARGSGGRESESK